MAKVALLVGVSEYELGLNPLPAAVKDVDAIQQVLLHPDVGAFAQADVMLLKNPDRQQLEEAIEHLFMGRQKDDLVLLFFSGHGIKDDTGRLYLATCKTRKNPFGELIRSSAVSASFVQDSMSRSRSKRQVVILDCCYSGAFAQGLSVKDDGTVNIREQLGGEGRAILTSSTSTQQSFEQEGSELSIYTQYLVEGIKTGAADTDDDGFISIDELHEYAKNKVRETHSSMNPEIYAIREGFKIRLTKVPLVDPKQRYRKEVLHYIDSRGEITFVGRSILYVVRDRLEISVQEATAIENEILEPYRKEYTEKIKQYERVFTGLIKEKPVINETDRQELQKFQQSLKLTDEDVRNIENQVITKIETHRQHCQQYKQILFKAIVQETFLSTSTINKLKQLQQQLQLSNEDVTSIETLVNQEIQTYKQKLQQYENLFLSTLQKEYPLSDSRRWELQQQQQLLKLTDEDIAPIKSRITTQIEEYQQKLQQYEQVLNNVIQREYPISHRTHEELRRFQQTLELSDSEVSLIEARVLKSREVVQPRVNNLSAHLPSPYEQSQQQIQEEVAPSVPHTKSVPISPSTSKSSTSSDNLFPTLGKIPWKVGLGLAGVLSVGFIGINLLSSQTPSTDNTSLTTTSADSNTATNGSGLKIGSLLPATGDLSSIGQQMIPSVPLLVDTVNACGGVNGQSVTLIQADDQTDPKSGAAGMTKLATVDKVAGVVGSFASSVSTAAVSIAAQNNVMLISPGSTSPVFTEQAKKGEFKGFWARTVPPDSYQGPALAALASKRGYKRVSTIVINNDYGVGFEKAFVQAFEKLGGTVVNKNNPVRYDPKATTFETEAAAAFGGKPDAVLGVFYVETGSLLLKSAYQQGLLQGVQVMLTDGMKSDEFPQQVGKTNDGKYIVSGVIGTVPGSNGKALESLTKLWQSKKNGSPGEFAPQSWDATAMLVLAAQAAKENTGTGIASKIREVSNAPGTEVTDVCEGLKLLKEGKDIDYQGASGNVDVDANGDVVGIYNVWSVGDDGKLKTIDKVSPK